MLWSLSDLWNVTLKGYLINVKNIHFPIGIEWGYLRRKRLIWKHSKPSFSKEGTAYSQYLVAGISSEFIMI